MKTSLKSWLTKIFGVPADANDDAFNAALGQSWLSDDDTKKMTPDLFKDLNTDAATKAAGEFDAKLDKLLALTEKNAAEIAELKAKPGGGLSAGAPPMPMDLSKAFAAGARPGGSEDDVAVRVKSVTERFSKGQRNALHYPMMRKSINLPHDMAGQPVIDGLTGRQLETPNELDKAVSGMYFKFVMNKTFGANPDLPHNLRWNEQDQGLWDYAVRELDWGGEIEYDGAKHELKVGRKLSPREQKALTDEVTSGGLELVPIVFDDQIISVAYLSGEIFPRVTVVPVARGRRMEGASIGEFTLSSQAQEQSSNITLQTTTAFITAFDTSIHVVSGGIELGLDFLSDTPIQNLGAIITEKYGEALLKWLDEQVQIGDGTTEPQGIFVASGTTTVAGGSANLTAAKYMDLMFGIPKEYRTGAAANQIAFCGTWTSYNRSRQLATTAASVNQEYIDQGHLGMSFMQQPYAIAGTNQTNAKISYCNYKRYRMYRRLGAAFRTTTEGKTLVLANNMLITMRARFGGQLETGSACSVTTTAAA